MTQGEDRFVIAVFIIVMAAVAAAIVVIGLLLPRSLTLFSVGSSGLVIGESVTAALLILNNSRRAGRRVSRVVWYLLAFGPLEVAVMAVAAPLGPSTSCYTMALGIMLFTWVMPLVAIELYLND